MAAPPVLMLLDKLLEETEPTDVKQVAYLITFARTLSARLQDGRMQGSTVGGRNPASAPARHVAPATRPSILILVF